MKELTGGCQNSILAEARHLAEALTEGNNVGHEVPGAGKEAQHRARLCQASEVTVKAVVCPLTEQESLKRLWLPTTLQFLPVE